MRPDLRALIILLGAVFLLLQGLRPGALPFMPEAAFSDAAISHWPAALHLRDTVGRGAFPIWQETILGGQPFAANPLNKVAYPFQWLALLFEPAPFLNLMLLAHMLLAGAGMWRFAQALGMSRQAALLAAVAYTFAPRWFAHLGAGHLDVLYALAWWPWLMWSVQRVVAGSGRLLLLVLVAALLLLADVRLSLFAFTLALLYGLASMRARPQWSWRLVWGPMSFLLLTAALIVPLLLWRPYLNRADLTASEAGIYALEAGHFVGLVLAAHGGNHETVTYLGLVVLLLALIGAVSALRRHFLWIAVIMVAALYALGSNGFLWPLLVQVLPPLLWFRVPSRAWLVVVLAASVLAGYGLDAVVMVAERLRDNEPLRRLALKRLAAAGLAGASLLCGALVLLALPDLDAETGIGLLVIGLVLGVLLLLALYGRVLPQTLAAALILLALADLAWVGRDWVVWRAPDFWLEHQQVLAERLETLIAASGWDQARIYSPNYALEQQVAATHDLRLFYGVDPFQLAGIVQAIAQGSGVPVTAYSVVLPPVPDVNGEAADLFAAANCDAVPDLEMLARWGVLYIVSRCPLAEAARLAAPDLVDGIYVYRNPAMLAGADAATSGWTQARGELPDDVTLAQINLWTMVAYGVSAITFAGVLIWLIKGKKPHA